ncbi:long-chain-fatty-acid--CoA ligase [Marinithermofilum abyssi]|uniref:Long-chain-fatty-acid--CoA ligase n=1 Tax=Marinithermofilum abyssi TaxID=1571185 RepID=A0A8J2VBT2_9BACL|nr:long-chain fatty acid--CoA ligase [Marinithermofilum abyssi]GGE12519.1 long-chain-fatty-acid--CoA ligase [Marinithermofilum abyssi]
MTDRHFDFWPDRMPVTLDIPRTTVWDNLAVSARRYPDRTAIYYYGQPLSYQLLLEEAEALAGFLQRKLHVSKGDRVLLFLQNSPQFILSFYAILRADAVVVPLNPMNVTEELAFYIKDCEPKAAIVGQELYDRIAPLNGSGSLNHIIVAAYSDYLPSSPVVQPPKEVVAPRVAIRDDGVTLWSEALTSGNLPGPHNARSDDLAVLPYTSGTTGRPKGCLHTHYTVQATLVGASTWVNLTPNTVALTTLPLFHVTGMQHSMNAPIFTGGSMVLMTRWDRDTAAELIQTHRCTHWTGISTMVVDFLANPDLAQDECGSLQFVGGGGAPLPEAVGEELYRRTGLRFVEGYGLSETMSQTHINPVHRPKLQCLGIPSFDVDACVVNPDTLQRLGPGEEGELLVRGPQVFKGYWNRRSETEEAFVNLDDGDPFFRTGDIARVDEEGYFFIVDRLKRMINASGMKVWPTEVESLLYQHPAVKHACVIGVPDDRRGETVKAFIVLKSSEHGKVSEEEIIRWSKERMAAYKYPRIVQFIDQLPMTGSGKILWRKLQDEERRNRKRAEKMR